MRNSIQVIFTLTLTSIVLVIGNAHLCHLQSIILEIALFFFLLSGCCIWTALAGTKSKAWLRTVLSLLIAFALQNAYLSWLHSESFPEAFLTQKAREHQAKVDDATTRHDGHPPANKNEPSWNFSKSLNTSNKT